MLRYNTVFCGDFNFRSGMKRIQLKTVLSGELKSTIISVCHDSWLMNGIQDVSNSNSCFDPVFFDWVIT